VVARTIPTTDNCLTSKRHIKRALLLNSTNPLTANPFCKTILSKLTKEVDVWKFRNFVFFAKIVRHGPYRLEYSDFYKYRNWLNCITN